MATVFASTEELLDYGWCRDLDWPQISSYAKDSNLVLTATEFFQGYSDREAKMQDHFQAERAKGQISILSEHW